MNEMKMESSFDWVKIPANFERKYLVKIVAKTEGKTDHTKDLTLPENERVIRNYSKEELQEAARSLAFRHVDINHDLGKLIPNALVIDAQYNDGQVECIAYIPSDYWINEIRTGKIKGVSIEQINREDIPMGDNTVDVKGIKMVGLALVTNQFNPGDKDTSISPMFEAYKDSIHFEISSINFPPEELKIKGEPFADYTDWEDCISKNQDKTDPEAYCGSIKAQTEAVASGSAVKTEAVSGSAGTPVDKDKRIVELETAVSKLQGSVKTIETSISTAKADAFKEGKTEVIKRVESVIPSVLVSKQFTGGTGRLLQDLKKVLREES